MRCTFSIFACVSAKSSDIMPYAFMVLAVADSAVSISVKPAVASCAEASIMPPRFSIGTDADSAL